MGQKDITEKVLEDYNDVSLSIKRLKYIGGENVNEENNTIC